MYTVAVSKKLTKADIDAFVETNPTATVTFVAKTADMCSNPTVTTVSWEACGSCKISKEAYEITLPDDECGNSAKEELQAAFPYLTIEDYGTPGGCQHKFKQRSLLTWFATNAIKFSKTSSYLKLPNLIVDVTGNVWVP